MWLSQWKQSLHHFRLKPNNKLHHIISIDNDCDVHHCKSDCNLYKSMPTNASMWSWRNNTIICVYLKDSMEKMIESFVRTVYSGVAVINAAFLFLAPKNFYHHMNQFVKAGPYPSTMYVQVVIPHHSSLTRKQILLVSLEIILKCY